MPKTINFMAAHLCSHIIQYINKQARTKTAHTMKSSNRRFRIGDVNSDIKIILATDTSNIITN